MNENLLDKAYQHCLSRGYRFTDPRARVLKILLDEKKPLGAYEILQILSRDIESPKPPTVYRAIQFWHQEGFIHCIDSLKAYVACNGGHHIGQTQFLICNHCAFVKELNSDIDLAPIITATQSITFSILSCTIEIKGLCLDCQQLQES